MAAKGSIAPSTRPALACSLQSSHFSREQFGVHFWRLKLKAARSFARIIRLPGWSFWWFGWVLLKVVRLSGNTMSEVSFRIRSSLVLWPTGFTRRQNLMLLRFFELKIDFFGRWTIINYHFLEAIDKFRNDPNKKATNKSNVFPRKQEIALNHLERQNHSRTLANLQSNKAQAFQRSHQVKVQKKTWE